MWPSNCSSSTTSPFFIWIKRQIKLLSIKLTQIHVYTVIYPTKRFLVSTVFSTRPSWRWRSIWLHRFHNQRIKTHNALLEQYSLSYNTESGASPRSVTVQYYIGICSMQSQAIAIWQNPSFRNNSHSMLIINDFNILLKDNENKTFASWPCCVL